MLSETKPIVDAMAGTFVQRDQLLASIGMVSVYFLLYRELPDGLLPTRSQFESFDKVRRLRRYEDEDDLTDSQFRLLEFDRLSQSPNDEIALRQRLDVLRDYLDDPGPFSRN